MNTNLKYLIWSGTLALIILSLFLLVMMGKVSDTATTTNTVSFSGEGKVLATPDVAIVNLSIVTQAADSKTAQDENSKKSQSVTAFLKNQDIDEKDIKTVAYNISPRYTYPRFDQPRISGYEVSQNIEVKVRNLDKVSNILDGVVSAGANRVNNFSFQIDDPEELKNQARKIAIENAKEKAEKLESQLDINLGKIINFSENTGGYPIPIFREASIDRDIGGGGPSLPEGENEIVVNITITYQIK